MDKGKIRGCGQMSMVQPRYPTEARTKESKPISVTMHACHCDFCDDLVTNLGRRVEMDMGDEVEDHAREWVLQVRS